MPKHRRRFWIWAVAALLAGSLLRLWFIAHLSRVAGDSLVYGDIARNLILHRTYGFTEHTPTGALQIRSTLIRLPGYPLFLAACFRLFGMANYQAVLYVQLVADLVTCWLAAALASRLFGARAFLPILWLAALCPFTANFVALPLTETLVLTTIALAFYALARWQHAGAAWNRWLWITAAALAYSILLRPEQGLLAAAVLPAMLWIALISHSKTSTAQPNLLHRSAPILAAALCVILPLVPWTIRNARTLHVFEPLAPRSASDPGEVVLHGFNRWYRTWAIEFASTEQVYWDYDGNPVLIRYLPTRAFASGCAAPLGATRESLPLYASTATLLDDYNRAVSTNPTLDARFGQLADQRIHAEPICYYALLPTARVLNMLLRPRIDMMPIQDEWWHAPTPLRHKLFALAYGSLNLAYIALAVAGLCFARKASLSPATKAILWSMAAALLLRAALLLTIDNSEPRYTLEFFPILITWAGGLFTRQRPVDN